MPLKTILFLVLFVTCAVGALWMPLLGVLGYIGHYCIGPERQWWAAPIRQWGLRYSYLLALLTGVGILLNFRRLRFGRPILRRQEWLLLLFLGIVWLSSFIGKETESYTTVDHPTVKMTKVIVFALMMTHVVTTISAFNALTWVLIGGALVLGLQAYSVPLSQFTQGRLETVGGPDFREANFLAAYLAAVLPLVGVQFLRSGWAGRIVCLLSGAFATNAIILTRSRGAMVGIGTGVLAAVILAPRRHRRIIIIGLLVAVVGAWCLMDPGFISRATTITRSEEERDLSAQSRLVIWRASWKLLKAHPFGVGAGNFFQSIGAYLPKSPTASETRTSRLVQADAHSTFVRCYSELGIQGIALFLALIVNCILSMRRVIKNTGRLPTGEGAQLMYVAYGLTVSLATVLASAITMTLIYNEFLWWFLALPVCVERAFANLKADAAGQRSGTLMTE